MPFGGGTSRWLSTILGGRVWSCFRSRIEIHLWIFGYFFKGCLLWNRGCIQRFLILVFGLILRRFRILMRRRVIGRIALCSNWDFPQSSCCVFCSIVFGRRCSIIFLVRCRWIWGLFGGRLGVYRESFRMIIQLIFDVFLWGVRLSRGSRVYRLCFLIACRKFKL